MKQSSLDDDIEEDIIQSSKDRAPDERYSSDFASDHITESIASYRGPSMN